MRALWPLNIENPSTTYRYSVWDQYRQDCQRIATEACVTIRTLDKALWQYSKTNQRALDDDK